MADIAPALTTHEKLLLSQAVHDAGTAWEKVHRLLDGHPLWTSHTREDFTKELCETAYIELMMEEGHDMSKPLPGADKPKSRFHVKLARKWFMERVNEVRTALVMEEERFRLLANEIEEIRAGKWDDRLKPEAPDDPTPEPSPEPAPEPERPVVEPEVSKPGRGRRKAPPTPLASTSKTEEPDATTAEEAAPTETPATATTERDGAPASKRGRGRGGRAGRGGRKSEAPTPVVEVPPATASTSVMEVDEPEARAETPATLATESVAGDEAESTPEPSSARGKGRKGKASKGTKRKRTPAESPVLSTNERKRAKTEDGGDDAERARVFKRNVLALHERITAHGDAEIFKKPVTRGDAPLYADAIKKATHLKAIYSAIKDGSISTIESYRRHMLLMYANACCFNDEKTAYHDETQTMCKYTEEQIDMLVSSDPSMLL